MAKRNSTRQSAAGRNRAPEKARRPRSQSRPCESSTRLRSGSGAGDHLHPGIVSLANSEISKAITAGTLTSDTGGPGSFALDQVHADRAHKLSLADGRRIGNVFRRDLGRKRAVATASAGS